MTRFVLTLSILSMLPTAGAATIVASSPGGSVTAFSPQIGQRAVLGFSWTQTSAFDFVSIQAVVGEIAETGMGTVYLMRSVGPGTTVADEIASATIDFPSAPGGNPPGDTVLFNGLSIGPGTYYLVMLTPFSNSASGAYWFAGSGLTEGTGSTFNGSLTSIAGIIDPYAPATNLAQLGVTTNLLFSVTGRESTTATPEPSSAVLLFAGAALIGLRKFRSSHPNRLKN
jgi:hypothetical protein